MVRAWYIDDSDEDQRLEHHLNPPKYVNIEKLKELTGVMYWKLDPVNYDQDGTLDQIRKARGYSYMDEIECSPDKLENYGDKLKMFFKEHIHSDEEIRFIVEGSGYFDCRDKNDRWIRIEVVAGDLITLPAGIYHRFTLDTKNYIRVKRLFVGEPVWTPINRPADDHVARQQYVNWSTKSFA